MRFVKTIDWGLYVVTDTALSKGRSTEEVIKRALAGGAGVVQLREKNLSTRELINRALALKEMLMEAGVPFIINDRVDIALAIDADGVHVGDDDMPAKRARELIGPDKILGVSVDTIQDAENAVAAGANYVGAGAVFATSTKEEAPAIGIDGLKSIVEAVDIPVVGIGGIKLNNVEQVIKTGATGVAVVSGIVSAENIEKAAKEFKETIDKVKG